MQMEEMKLKNMTDVCTNCPYLAQYLDEKIDIATARYNCGYKCQNYDNKNFIYKFDVVYSLYQHQKRKEFKGKGRQPVAEKRYGRAARALQEEGKKNNRNCRVAKSKQTNSLQNFK